MRQAELVCQQLVVSRGEFLAIDADSERAQVCYTWNWDSIAGYTQS